MTVTRQYIFVQVARVIVIGTCMFIGVMATWGAGDALPFSHPYDRVTYKATCTAMGAGLGLLAAIIMNRFCAPLP